MKTYTELAKEIGVHRASIGRIIKREKIEFFVRYEPSVRKNVREIKDEDADFIVSKYKVKGK